MAIYSFQFLVTPEVWDKTKEIRVYGSSIVVNASFEND